MTSASGLGPKEADDQWPFGGRVEDLPVGVDLAALQAVIDDAEVAGLEHRLL